MLLDQPLESSQLFDLLRISLVLDLSLLCLVLDQSQQVLAFLDQG